MDASLYRHDPNAAPGVCLSAAIAASDSTPVSIRSSVRAPMIPLRRAYTLPRSSECWRAVCDTPQAEALITTVTPPDWAYKAFLGAVTTSSSLRTVMPRMDERCMPARRVEPALPDPRMFGNLLKL